eukprot:UN08832
MVLVVIRNALMEYAVENFSSDYFVFMDWDIERFDWYRLETFIPIPNYKYDVLCARSP